MLVDTGDSMKKSNTSYHQWIMSQYHSITVDYLECGADIEYDMVQLLTTLDLKGLR